MLALALACFAALPGLRAEPLRVALPADQDPALWAEPLALAGLTANHAYVVIDPPSGSVTFVRRYWLLRASGPSGRE